MGPRAGDADRDRRGCARVDVAAAPARAASAVALRRTACKMSVRTSCEADPAARGFNAPNQPAMDASGDPMRFVVPVPVVRSVVSEISVVVVVLPILPIRVVANIGVDRVQRRERRVEVGRVHGVPAEIGPGQSPAGRSEGNLVGVREFVKPLFSDIFEKNFTNI